jgi:DNA repair protein RecO (recombination protein O)
MLYQTEGIVLSSMDLGEDDRIVSILTAQKGLVRAVVRGARKPTGRLAAVTQPFCRADFQLYGRSSLDRVIQVSLLDSYPGIVGDYAKVVYASYLAEVVSGLMPEHERNPGVYRLFLAILDSIKESNELWTVARWAELRLLRSAGFLPSFDGCSSCGRSLAGSVYFSPQAGGVLCGACRAETTTAEMLMPVSSGSVKTLSLIAASADRPNIVARGKVRDEAALVMREYIAQVLGKRPKSLSLVERLEEEGS